MSKLVNFGEVGLVDRLGRAGVARGDRRTAPLPPVVVLLGCIRGVVYVSSVSVAEVGDVGVVNNRCCRIIDVEGGLRGEQHPVGRGGGREHPTSGVVEAGCLRAALRGVLGVVPNSGV